METWKEFEANELTHSAAHHLLAIYEVGLEYGGWARVSDIANELGITRGSVSINLRTLKKRGFLDTDDRRLVKLSEKGLKAAQAVMAKKAVVKTFLRKVLDDKIAHLLMFYGVFRTSSDVFGRVGGARSRI